MADDFLTPEDNKEIDRKRYEVMKKRILELAKGVSVTKQDENGGFYQGNAAEYLSEPGSDIDEVWTTDEKGGAKPIGLRHAVLTNAEPLDPNTLRQDWGDSGATAQGEIDSGIVPYLGTVNEVDGRYIDVDDKGNTAEIMGGEDQAYEMIRNHEAKPGPSFMSASRLARKKLREQESEPDVRKSFPLPSLDKTNRSSVMSSYYEEVEEDDPEKQKLSRL